MKKLFASLLAATMVAGMAVSAFAYVGTTGKDIAEGNAVGITAPTIVADVTVDYSLTKTPYNKDGESVTGFDGGKLYFPILVSNEVYNENDTTITGYAYAEKASEIEDLKAKIKATFGKEYVEKEVNIVRKDNIVNGVKVYCVEVKVADFADVTEKEVEFDVTLYNKGRKQVEVKDVNLTLGSDAYKIDLADGDMFDSNNDDVKDIAIKDGLKGSSASTAYKGLYKVKFNKNELEATVLPEAGAVVLEEAIGANGTEDVETISLDFVKANATFDVAASAQGDLFLGYSTDANKAVVLANQDAEINFVDFDANPQFDFNGTLRLTVEDADKTNFCYELVDGKLVAAGKYNAEDECFEIRTSKLTSYVLSDKELVNPKAEEKPAEEKPVVEKPADKVVGTGAIA